jgi:hypothetical protein
MSSELTKSVREGFERACATFSERVVPDAERGYKDIDPEHCWEQWQEARKHLIEDGPGDNA